MARRPSIPLVLTIAVAIAGCSASQEGAAHAGDVAVAARNPLAAKTFYLDPADPAAAQARQWRQSGRTQDADAMLELARQPTAEWLTGTPDDAARVRATTLAAARAHETPVLAAYNIPNRDCGQFSAGGADSGRSYRNWVVGLARAIGSHSAVVIVEPDALAQAASGCLSKAATLDRYRLLRFAVDTLAALPRTAVYLDAGNAGWINPVARLVRPLRLAGIGKANGFALNVSNFYTTAQSVGYGRALSARVGGKHFVIDTSRNGNGPYTGNDGAPSWCNPPGRAIGQRPTARTGNRLVDAFLWIKVPGESDGACRPGAPAAGQWWPDYALSLVRAAG